MIYARGPDLTDALTNRLCSALRNESLSFSLRMQIAPCEFVVGGDYNEVINGGYVGTLDSAGRLLCCGEMRDTPTHDLCSNKNHT